MTITRKLLPFFVRAPEAAVRLFALSAAILGAGCGDDEPPFLPLADLCDVYAEEVCDGRQACCEGFDRDVCETGVREACEGDVQLLTMNGDLSYDGKRANRVRNDLSEGVSDCSAPLPLGTFFDGALENGKSCQEASQCQSLTCSADASGTAMVCSDSVTATLCEPADI